jgi:hypothetical protein
MMKIHSVSCRGDAAEVKVKARGAANLTAPFFLNP